MLTASLDEIKETHRRVTLRFALPAEKAPMFEGAEQVRRRADAIGAALAAAPLATAPLALSWNRVR